MYPVKTPAQGIGLNDFNETEQFGSDGRLLSVVYHSAGYGAILTHEIGHIWSAYAGDNFGLLGAEPCLCHWIANTDIAGIESNYVITPNWEIYLLKDLGNGTFKGYDPQVDSASRKFSPLELYMMGLISPEDVSPIHLILGPNYTNMQMVTGDVRTITIDQIIVEEGLRVPTYPHAPKEFNVGFIYFSNRDFSPAELAWGSMIASAYTSKGTFQFMNTFYNATGQRATLNAHLSDWGVPVGLAPYQVPWATSTPKP
jgi:hypothetical protein